MSLIQSLETAIKDAIDDQALSITGSIAHDSQAEPAYPYFLVDASTLQEDAGTEALTVTVSVSVIDDAFNASSTIEAKAEAIRGYLEGGDFEDDLDTNLTGIAHVGIIHSWGFGAETTAEGQRIEDTTFTLILT